MTLYLNENSARRDSWALLQQALADYMGEKGLERATARFIVGLNPYGKPRLEDAGGPRFSISHSGRFWACLVWWGEVGLDVESLDDRRGEPAYLRIARRFFAADEILSLEACADHGELALSFYRIWTKKEAYVKYLGRGLGFGLGGFSTIAGVPGARLGSVELDGGLVASYCHGETCGDAGVSLEPVIKIIRF